MTDEIEKLTGLIRSAGQYVTWTQAREIARALLADHAGVVPGSAAWARDTIADFIADNWPDRKYTLSEIEARIRDIELCPPAPAAPPADPMARFCPGWRLVPEEPTREMLDAATVVDNEAFCGGSTHGATVDDIWAAMLRTAPKPSPIA